MLAMTRSAYKLGKSGPCRPATIKTKGKRSDVTL